MPNTLTKSTYVSLVIHEKDRHELLVEMESLRGWLGDTKTITIYKLEAWMESKGYTWDECMDGSGDNNSSLEEFLHYEFDGEEFKEQLLEYINEIG